MATQPPAVREGPIRAHVITVSDSCFAGEATDISGPAVVEMLTDAGFQVMGSEIVPDERDRIVESIMSGIEADYELVVTTGGTGIAPRDITPDATRAVIDYEIPGLSEEMRRVGTLSTPQAVLSRALAGVSGRTLVINLPGSMRGALESLGAVLPVVSHAVDLLHGQTRH